MAYRVIQWGTGAAGKDAVRAIAANPDLELVGARVWDPAKAGRDVGAICGIDDLGVAASTDEAELLSNEADCVLWMGEVPTDPQAGLEELCRILASGKNVITIVHSPFIAPGLFPPEIRDPIDRACAEGNSSLHATGGDPGFASDVFALTLSALCQRIERVQIRELLDYSGYDNAQIIFEIMGFGRPLDDPAPLAEMMVPYFGASLALLAEGLGETIEDIQTSQEVRATEADLTVAAGEVSAGTIGAIRFSFAAIIGGTPRLVIEHITRLDPGIAPDWPHGQGYTLSFEGEPSMEIDLRLGTAEGASELADAVRAATMHAVHSVPAVCDADPGIRTFLDLPLITGRHTLKDAGG